jgi:hypothetical protein
LVATIDNSVFEQTFFSSLTVDKDNRHFSSFDQFLLDFEGISIRRWFGAGREVQIPPSVQSLQPNSFSELPSLVNVVFLPVSSLRIIGEAAFSSCEQLASICIPNSVEILGASSFASCPLLSNVRFECDSKCAIIGARSFEECLSLRSIDMPRSVQIVDTYCFSKCSELAQVSFESGSLLSSIGDAAFQECSRLARFLFPGSVLNKPAEDAFCASNSELSDRMPGNATFELLSTVSAIGNYAFHRLALLKSICIPGPVRDIGENCFSGCPGLSAVTFESDSHLLRIAESAFSDCTALTSIRFPKSIQSLCRRSFARCFRLCDAVFETGCELRAIDDEAFADCRLLRSIFIPRYVEVLCIRCFADCEGLLRVDFERNSSLRHIQTGAFEHCGSLDCLQIPRSVERLGERCFCCCENLEFVTVEAGSRLQAVGRSFARLASQLRSVWIPSSVANVFLACLETAPPFSEDWSQSALTSEVARDRRRRRRDFSVQGSMRRHWVDDRVAIWSLVVFEDCDCRICPVRSVAEGPSFSDEFRFGYEQACEDLLINRVRVHTVTGVGPGTFGAVESS